MSVDTQLEDVFRSDLTSAEVIRGGCGGTAVLARAHLDGRRAARVLRCATCGHVLARVVTTAQHLCCAHAGIRTVRVPLGPGDPHVGGLG